MSFKLPKRDREAYEPCPEGSEHSEEERRPLAEKDIEELSYSYSRSESRGWATPRSLSICAIIVANVLLFLASTAIILTNGSSREVHCSEKEYNVYSPMYDKLEIKKSFQHFNHSFWQEFEPSIFLEPPSREAEKAWSRLSDTNSIALSVDEVRQMGYDPEEVWPIPRDALDDPDVPQYFGMIDVFHQVHCLNMLRWQSYPDYYGNLHEKYKDYPMPWEQHIRHCTYSLLRNILCHADVEVTVFQKFKGWPGLNANFALDRQCRNYQDILEWKEAHEVIPNSSWAEFPDRPFKEVDPEGFLAPWGRHDSRKEMCDSHGANCVEIPSHDHPHIDV